MQFDFKKCNLTSKNLKYSMLIGLVINLTAMKEIATGLTALAMT